MAGCRELIVVAEGGLRLGSAKAPRIKFGSSAQLPGDRTFKDENTKSHV
jgi:hypothetical protein